MKTTYYKLKVIFLTEVLGSRPSADVMNKFIVSRGGITMPEDEQHPDAQDVLDSGTTTFARNDKDEIILYDYAVKGFFKEAGRVLNGRVSGGVKNLKAKVRDNIYAAPREIKLHFDKHGVDFLEHLVRTESFPPRTTMARSELLPAGTWFECALEVLDGGGINESVLRDLLDYGALQGIGEFRGGGYDRFRYELQCEEG